MNPRNSRRYCFYLFIILFLCTQHFSVQLSYGKEVDEIGEAKHGIVEIKSGFTDKNGRFHMIKRTSGCLICNGDGNTYVATTYHSVTVTSQEKAAYCEEKEIKAEVNELTDSIRIMIKGDVNVEASVMTESQVQDYCILSVDSVINEKNALKLGNSGKLKTGDPVYALGFPDEASGNRATQYAASEVELHAGYVQDPSSKNKEAVCVQHSSVVTPGNSGGALVDADGYLVGLNNSDYTNLEIKAYYSLAVDEIKEILDNYGILYESKDQDLAYQDLKNLYEECKGLYESGDYKGESLLVLQQNLQAAATAMEESGLTIEAIQENILLLEGDRESLVKKMPLSRKVVYVLGGCCLILLAKLVHLLIVKRKISKSVTWEKGQKESPAQEGEKEEQGKWQRAQTNQQNTGSAAWQKESDWKQNVSIEHIEKEEGTMLLFDGKDELEDDRTELHNPLSNIFQRNANKASLEQERTGKLIPISKPEFLIGKKPDLVDYAVTDNKVVSRLHAAILWEDGVYSVQDKESVNGTFVNGKQIGIEAINLKNGDEIALANETFIFKLSENKYCKRNCERERET